MCFESYKHISGSKMTLQGNKLIVYALLSFPGPAGFVFPLYPHTGCDRRCRLETLDVLQPHKLYLRVPTTAQKHKRWEHCCSRLAPINKRNFARRRFFMVTGSALRCGIKLYVMPQRIEQPNTGSVLGPTNCTMAQRSCRRTTLIP